MLAGGVQWARPLPAIAAVANVPTTEAIGAGPPAIPWPAQGQAAVLVDGIDVVASRGPGAPAPMASTAKIMTALLVLEDHPLAAGDPGPVLTVSQADVATFYAMRNQNESVLPVATGEQLSEYQLLQGLLLPSASNFAEMLARWDAGSVPAFIGRMNVRATALGLTQTKYADASGFSPGTASTPADLIKLAQVAMRLPVFAQVVGQPQATIPVAGVVKNLDRLLGQDGIVGVKTGHTDDAGGCFVGAADVTVDGQRVRLYTAVMGQPNALDGAFAATPPMLHALSGALHLRTLVKAGGPVAQYQAAWGETGAIVASQGISWVLEDGMTVTRRTSLSPLTPGMAAGTRVGTLVIETAGHHGETPLVLAAPLAGPDAGWRLLRGL